MHDRHALLIGIPGCDNRDLFESIPEQVIRRDITRMARSLGQSEYEITVLGVAPDAEVPIDRHIADVPSRNRCLDEIQAACERVPQGGTLIIYFTGHGVRVEGGDFMVPQDYTRRAQDGRHRRDRLIPANFAEEAASCQARLLLCVIDACRDEESSEDTSTSGQSVPELPAGVFVLLRGCEPGETCQFDPEQGSLFTRAFARALHRNESPQTLGQVIQATKDKLREVPQRPKAVFVAESAAILETKICAGVRLLDDWRTAVETTPLWDLVDEPATIERARTAIRELVGQYGNTVGQQRRLLEEGPLRLPEVWSDDGYPTRVLNGLYLLLNAPGREKATLRAAEVATLVAAPFFREAVLSTGLADVPDADPRDLERRFGTGFRSDFENILANNEQLARRGAGLAEKHPHDRDIVAMWLVHRWILEREDLWETAACRAWSSELARIALTSAGQPAGAARVAEFADTVRTMLRSVATVLGPAADELPDHPVRARALGHLLSIAGVLGGDPRRMTSVLADHVGTHDPVDLERLRDALEADARWTWDNDTLIMDAVCDHPAVHACLEDLASAADDACTVARKAAETVPSKERVLLAGVPKRCDENLRPQKSAYDKPLLRFHLAGDRVRDLLMGTQLYGDPAVAIRELYQNALDACRYRHMRLRCEYGTEDPPGWRGKIVLREDVDPETGRAYIECEDNGVGMTESILRHAFTAAGTRFVHTEAFRREAARWRRQNDSYRLYPNSQFGIGVFSYFMLADEVFLWTTATDERGVGAQSRLHLRIPGHGGLFRLRRDEPMPTGIRSGGTVLRLYLSGGTDVSATDLGDYLVVSDYDVEVWKFGELQLSWSPSVPREQEWLDGRRPVDDSSAIPVPPRPAGEDFWWVTGPGDRLADGLRTQIRRGLRSLEVLQEQNIGYGRLVNLAGMHQPQLSVDRERIVSWDREWVNDQVTAAVPALLGWPGFTWSWLWQVGRYDPALASMIVEQHATSALPTSTSDGSLTAVVGAVGFLPYDNGLLKLDIRLDPGAEAPTKILTFMAPWRLAVWRTASGDDLKRSSIEGLPADVSGFPIPTTDDALALRVYQISQQVAQSLGYGAEWPNTDFDLPDLLYRLRRFAIAGLDLKMLQGLPLESDAFFVVAVSTLPRETTPIHLLNLSSAGQLTVARVYELLNRRNLAEALPELSYQDKLALDFVATRQDTDILGQRIGGFGERLEVPSAQVERRYIEQGMQPEEAELRVDALRRLGFLIRPSLPQVNAEPTALAARIDELLVDKDNFAASALTELAYEFGLSEAAVYDLVVHAADRLLRPLRRGLGDHLPLGVPSEKDHLFASFVGDIADLPGTEVIIGYRMTNLARIPPREYASLFERNTHLVAIPIRLTTADAVSLADQFETTIDQAATMLVETFTGWRDVEAVGSIPASGAALRPTSKDLDALTYKVDETRTWRGQTSPVGVVKISLPRGTIGKAVERLAQYRCLGANVPDIDPDLAAYRPDKYDELALTVAGVEDGGEVMPIDLVRVAGRFGWPVRTAYDRLHRFHSLGVHVAADREDCPDAIVHWQDLIVLSQYFDGARPGLAGTVTADQIREAAEAVREAPPMTRDRLRKYAALFGLDCEELA